MKKALLWLTTLAWAALIWRLTTTEQIVVAQDSWLQSILMMCAHFAFFGILAFFLNLSSFSSYVAVSVTSLYGLVIELVQKSIPGRSADPMDWVLDTLGAIAFLFVFKKLQSKS